MTSSIEETACFALATLYSLIWLTRKKSDFRRKQMPFGLLVWTGIGVLLAALAYGGANPGFSFLIVISSTIIGAVYCVSRNGAILGISIPIALVVLKIMGLAP